MIVILGGGLSGSLLAYRLSLLTPRPNFLLIEASDRLGGNHTWSFHKTDLSSRSFGWVQDLITCSWEKQEVRFKDFTRVLSKPYFSVTSHHLNCVLQNKISANVLLNEKAVRIDGNDVYLNQGKVKASAIFDARGFSQSQTSLCGYQKFVGIELELEKPHGLVHPVIMDATCVQKDGFRFFYTLPWSSHSLLVEDTRYSLDPDLDLQEFKGEIRSYAQRSGWNVLKENRIEQGSLPIPFFRDKSLSEFNNVIPIGVRGGYFHYTTGYSFAWAVKTADAIAEKLIGSPQAQKCELTASLKPLQRKLKQQSSYLALLNRMLFLAASPSDRWKIFHRFYHFHENLIFRFYSGKLAFRDRLRILCGKPPVPVALAVKSIFNPSKLFFSRSQISRT